MKPNTQTLLAPLLAGMLAASSALAAKSEPIKKPSTFGEDVAFLQQHADAIVLRHGKAAVVLAPAYQGRVMTATARGDATPGSGWINYDLVSKGVQTKEEAAGKLEAHIHAFGGEERLWFGPEGGQYGIFFAPGTKFDFADWFTPPPIDTEAWTVTGQSATEVSFRQDFELRNHSGTNFKVRADRRVELLDGKSIASLLGADLPAGVDAVAYRSVNSLTNRGDAPWKPDSGLLSIWLLCMFKPSPTTTAFIPYREGPDAELGPVVNADYFGQVPPARLQSADGMTYFRCDGRERGKIGVDPRRSKGVAGSYDPVAGRVTLLLFEQPKEHKGYVNSMWKQQKEPYKGDAINAYNDGPVGESGEQMGPFYELESSSPALLLQPGETATHSQTILHLYGREEDLQKAVSSLTGVDLAMVRTRFPASEKVPPAP